MADIKVGGELRASAGVVRVLAEELAKPTQTALTATSTASGSMTGWSMAAVLEYMSASWAAPLGKIKQRMTDTGVKLEANASGHEHNEQAITAAWQGGVQ